MVAFKFVLLAKTRLFLCIHVDSEEMGGGHRKEDYIDCMCTYNVILTFMRQKGIIEFEFTMVV